MNTTAIISSKLEHMKALFFSGSELQAGNSSEIFKVEHNRQTYILEWRILSNSLGMNCIEMACFSSSSPDKKTQIFLYLSEELGF